MLIESETQNNSALYLLRLVFWVRSLRTLTCLAIIFCCTAGRVWAQASFAVALANSSAYQGQPNALTVTALDADGNLVASYSGTPVLGSTDASSTFSTLAFSNGVGTATVTFATAGAQTVTATDGSITGTSMQVWVQPPPKFVVTVNTDTTTGTASNCTDQNALNSSPDANCSLRDALSAAAQINASFPSLPVTVTFSPSVFSMLNTAAQNTIQLSAAGTLFLPSNTSVTGPITGSGASLANLVTVNGANLSTVFTVLSGITNAALANLTITAGAGSSTAGQTSGGGVYNNGTLAVMNCTITNNSSGLGGGIENDAGGFLTLVNSTLSGNNAGQGGGIYNNSGTVIVEGSTLSGNSAGPSTSGGGIYNLGTLTVTASTVTGNVTGFAGGGIYSPGATTPTIANSIVSGNWVGTAASVNGYDDLDDGSGSATFTGGIGDGGGNILGYYNLFNSPPATAASPAINLAPLGNYGGPTQTMIPLPGSGAICAGLQGSLPANVTTDQRGLIFDPNCPANSVDSGAVQSNYALSFTTEPPASVTAAIAMSPAPVVTVTESGNLLEAGPATVSVTDAGSDLASTPATAATSTANGQASFSSLVFINAETSDTLSASLTLNGAVSISAVSSSFAVAPGTTTPMVTVTPSSSSITTAQGLSVVVSVAGVSGTPPTGAVVLTGGGYSGTQILSGGGTTFSIAAGSLSTGSDTFSAFYTPDSFSSSAYNPATGTAAPVMVMLATQSIAFANPGAQIVGTPLTLVATATSGLAVSFSSETAGVCITSGTTATFIASGTCVLDANQSGNGTYSAASQVQQSFTVSGEAQSITFPALPPVTFSAAPISLNATASSGLPVSFASTTPSICSVSGSTVTLLAVGTCGIAATQAGNGGYTAATAVSQSFAIAIATQSITFAALPDQNIGAAPFVVSATASSCLPVSFTSANASFCTVSGSTVTLLAVGTCTITAAQAGNTDYVAAPTVSQSFTVHHTPQTISFAALPAVTFGTAPFSLSATASSGLPVSFAPMTPSICTVSGNIVTVLALGTCEIAANQAGNSQYAAAATAAHTFAVTLAQQTITFAALPDQTYGAAPFSVGATASSGLAISFASTTPSACTVSGSTVTLVASGACTIQATQPGNTDYAAAPPVSQTFTVHHQPQTITFAALPGLTYTATPFAVSATASSGLPVSFTSTTPSICAVSGNNVTLLSIGTCGITATQPGNAIYAAAPASAHTFAVTSSQQAVTFAALPDQTYGAAPFTLSASASSGLPVSFASTTPSVCTVSASTVSLLAIGTCTISATQAGNADYTAAPAVSESFTVHHEPQTISFAGLPAVPFSAGPLTVSASASSGLPVSFASSTPSICSVSGNSVTLLGLGTCEIVATQAGNNQYASAPASAHTFAVTLSQQAITFAPLPAVTYSVVPLFVSATASSGLPVSLASTNPSVCSVSGNTVSLLAVGACGIAATQAGNAGYAAAATVTQTFAVTIAAQSITFAALPDQTYGAAPFSLNATASSGLPVSFTSTNSSVCTVSGSIVTLISAGTCTINATQAGNNDYAVAPGVSQGFNVHLEAQTISFAALPAVTYGSAPFSLSASASSGLPVIFASTTPSVCTVSANTVAVLSGGTCGITATQGGNTNYAAAPPVQ